MLENKAMLDVFCDSGFECHTRTDGGYVEIDLSVIPTEASVTRAEMRDRISTTASLHPFFQPRSVAIVGVSRNPANIGTRILSAFINAAFRGPIYPINPNATSIMSLPTYPPCAICRKLPNSWSSPFHEMLCWMWLTTVHRAASELS
jgi:acetate---CoA ligase (ADP-forming)